MTAWEALLKSGICEMPVNLGKVCQGLGIRLYTTHEGYPIIKALGLGNSATCSDGFAYRDDQLKIIFYARAVPKERRRFTVAHEIGHLALEHDGSDAEREEREASRFASHLLAPSCVLRGVGAYDSGRIMRLCGMSYTAARIAAERMMRSAYKERDYYRQWGRPQFFLSETEWRLYRQFEPFIKENKAQISSSLWGMASSSL